VKYVISEIKEEKFGDTRVFNVYDHKAEWPKDNVAVWWSHGVARCTACSSPLRGMSASCKHARAVKRVAALA
jgi:hypothetical protein